MLSVGWVADGARAPAAAAQESAPLAPERRVEAGLARRRLAAAFRARLARPPTGETVAVAVAGRNAPQEGRQSPDAGPAGRSGLQE